MSNTSAYMVASLLEKMTNEDTDFRYMATNDLMNELQKDTFSLEEATEKKVITAVLNLMNDKNGEVQNLAVKCLAPLVRKVREAQIQDMIDQLCNFTQQMNEELRDIASIGLKTVIIEIPIHSPIAANVCKRLVPRLLAMLNSKHSSYEVQMDTLDLLAEILSRFGPLVTPDIQKQTQAALLPLLSHPRPAVRKRTTVALGNLVMYSSDDLFNELVAHLLAELRAKPSNEKVRTLVVCVGTLSRFSAPRLGKYLNDFLPLVIAHTEEASEDDELRENCLQTLESFVLRCPTEITPWIDRIVGVCLAYLKYDPNYAGDDEEEEEEGGGEGGEGEEGGDDGNDVEMSDGGDSEDEEDEENEEEEEDEEEDDYSDDDDISWKVRRSSSKVLAAIIGTRHELLKELYRNVAPALIARFKEREESVRVDVLQTFIVLLRQTLVYGGGASLTSLNDDTVQDEEERAKRRRANAGGDAMETEESPKRLLRNQVPRLSKTLSKQLVGKSTQTRQMAFTLLRELVTVLQGGLENHIALFLPAIESSLAASGATDHHHIGTNSNLKIETLTFLRQLLKVHPPAAFHRYLGRLSTPVIAAANDKFYKITAEAFQVCVELIRVIRPVEYIQATQSYRFESIQPGFTTYVEQIYKITMSRLSTPDADQEVKERSIMCLGTLLSQAGDVLVAEQERAFAVLLERLRNEITRLTTVRVLAQVMKSPVCEGPQVKAVAVGAVDEVSVLLRKSQRLLRVASLGCLEVLIKRYGKFMAPQSYSSLLTELRPLITDADLHLLPMSLSTIVCVLHANSSTLPQIQAQILPQIFVLVQSPLVQGAALDSLLTLFAALVRTQPASFAELKAGLVAPIVTGVEGGQVGAVKQAYVTVAQCVAILGFNVESHIGGLVKGFVTDIQNAKATDSAKYLALLTLGEIGRRVDLSSHETLTPTILELFSAGSEEVKSAAAFALGNIAVGNLPKYLPPIIEEIKIQPKKRYLLLHALKEIITRYSSNEGGEALKGFSPTIWTLLFDSCDSGEEGTRNVVAECLGKLTLTDPYTYLPELQNRLQSQSAQTRGTVVTAIKYTFTDQAQNYDDLLRPVIVQFLSLMKDYDLNVRRLSLSTLNSAAHNKPYLIRDVLGQLVPLLYQETVVKEELIRLVEMGPFKHKVDDGLEIRKTAFECMYTLLDTCLDKIEIFGFLDRVLAGLADTHDIKVLSHLMISRLAGVAPTAISQKLDDTVDPFRETINFKVKTTAVKQEIEKNQELVRSAMRAIAILAKLSEPATTPKFDAFTKEVKTGSMAEEFKSVVAEAESRDIGGRGTEYMDLS